MRTMMVSKTEENLKKNSTSASFTHILKKNSTKQKLPRNGKRFKIITKIVASASVGHAHTVLLDVLFYSLLISFR